MQNVSILAVAAAAALLSSCTQTVPAVQVADIDQANLCEVSRWSYEDTASACRPGQKVVFLPKTFGNKQLPILFAGVNCDLRYSVALTDGAVTCIYGPITPAKS